MINTDCSLSEMFKLATSSWSQTLISAINTVIVGNSGGKLAQPSDSPVAACGVTPYPLKLSIARPDINVLVRNTFLHLTPEINEKGITVNCVKWAKSSKYA